MKERAVSLLLANLAVVSLVLPALAAASAEEPAGTPVESLEIQEERSAILLDGEPAWVEYQMMDDVCYVTVSSFVSLVDAEAMVEEEGGVVSVNASVVTGIVPVEGELQQPAGEPSLSPTPPEEGEPAQEEPDGSGDFSLSMTGEGQLEPSYAAADATADLNMLVAVGASYFVANGRYLYAEDGVIELNGRVAAPVRLLAKVFNLSVDYDPVNGQVLLARQPGAEPYLASGDAVYDSESLMWLARIIFAESGNQPLEGKIAVGNVVMNRVNNPGFPDTVYEVIFQKNQFSPAISGSIYQDPNWDSMVAAMLVLDGAQVVPDALFFNQAGMHCYASRHRDYVATIGDHAFYN